MTDRIDLINELRLEEALDRELSIKSLHHFIQSYWHLVEPASPFVNGWHIEAICEHLEAVKTFDIKKLVICMPPRHSKSSIVSVFFPAWVWADKLYSSKKFVSASYSAELSIRDSTKMRDIIDHEYYKERLDLNWKIKDDQNQKKRFQNTNGGVRFSTSVGGMMTGEGGDYLIIDDPQSVKLAHSELERKKTVDWWSGTMSTRSIDPEKVARIVIMQRLHEGDLAGKLIEDGYERLILPAEFNSKAKIISHTNLNWKDPRTEDGELLWPRRFTQDVIADLKVELGSTNSMAQLQQDPQPGDGGLFNRNWWNLIDKLPNEITRIVQFYDTAQKPGITNDYSVCATWGEMKNGYVLLHLWREKVTTPILEQKVIQLYDQWQPDEVVIEDKSSGSSLIQYLRYNTSLPVIAYMPKFDKEVRAAAATPTVEAGNCFIMPLGIVMENRKEVDLREAFISEHEKFPLSSHDDTVDTTSMMVKHFKKTVGPRIRRL